MWDEVRVLATVLFLSLVSLNGRRQQDNARPKRDTHVRNSGTITISRVFALKWETKHHDDGYCFWKSIVKSRIKDLLKIVKRGTGLLLLKGRSEFNLVSIPDRNLREEKRHGWNVFVKITSSRGGLIKSKQPIRAHDKGVPVDRWIRF